MTTEPTKPTDAAAALLDEAKHIITGARRAAYGNPEDNFKTIADLWTVYLKRRRCIPLGGTIQAHDVAVMMILMKCARLAETPGHHDSALDVAGYAACLARCQGASAPAEPSPAGPPVGVVPRPGMLIRGLLSDRSIVQRVCDIEGEPGAKCPILVVSRHDIPHSTVRRIVTDDAEVRWPYEPDTAWKRVYPHTGGGAS